MSRTNSSARFKVSSPSAEPDRRRCAWAQTPLGVAYHDDEWGVPVYDDRVLFEFLILEGAQAGLSWETILRKRPAYRQAFAGFDPVRVARFRQARIERLLENPGIIRNRLKIAAAVRNAKAFLAVVEEFGSFEQYLRTLLPRAPIVNRWRAARDVPARTTESDALSKDLSRRGFSFVGSTICYAFMQAVGLVNDHTTDCFRYKALSPSAARSAYLGSSTR
jgi:DNA-3-methyladenine glycosylase I